MHLVWEKTTMQITNPPAWEFPDSVSGQMMMQNMRLSVSLCLVPVQAIALPTVTTSKIKPS